MLREVEVVVGVRLFHPAAGQVAGELVQLGVEEVVLDELSIGCFVEDFIEIGIDSYNPLEAKADLDCVDLRRQYGHRFGVCGNSNIQIWETGDREKIREEVLRKLNAAKGGGMIFQSDHSVSSSVSGKTYDFIVNLVREFGQYPLDLGEYDMDMTSTTGKC